MDVAAAALFWFTVFFTAASAVLVGVARRLLHSAIALCLCFLGVAGIYLFLHADFLAGVQVIVYVGGILVLILFAIMFSSHLPDGSGEGRRRRLTVAAGAAIGLLALAALGLFIGRASPVLDAALEPHTEAAAVYRPTVDAPPPQEGLGHLLLGRYLLPFEAISILLLAALLGAVVIVRKEARDTGGEGRAPEMGGEPPRAGAG